MSDSNSTRNRLASVVIWCDTEARNKPSSHHALTQSSARRDTLRAQIKLNETNNLARIENAERRNMAWLVSD